MAHAKSFFPGGLKFNVASVKNNHNYEKKYFEHTRDIFLEPGREIWDFSEGDSGLR